MEEVQCFKYLNSHVDKTEQVEAEVESRVKKESQVLRELKSLLSCKTLGMC